MLNFCGKYISKYKTKMGLYLFVSLISTLIAIIIPVFWGKTIDLMILSHDIYSIVKLGLVVLILGLLNILICYWNYRLYILIQTNSAQDISAEIIHHLHKISLTDLERFDMGYLNESINNDSNSIVMFFMSLIVNALSNGVMLILSLFVLCTISFKIGVTLFLLIGLYIVFFFCFRGRLLRKAESYKNARSIFFSALLEQFENIKFIKQHALEYYYKNKLKKDFNLFFQKALDAQQFFYLYSSVDNVLEVALNFCIYILGGIGVIKGSMTIGGFTIILNFYRNIISSIKYFANLGKEYQENSASYKRLNNYWALKEQQNGEEVLGSISTITCRDLGFSRNNLKILKGFNATLKRGSIYCIQGQNGSGKTTLMELIMGLFIGEYDGAIYYNNLDIEKVDMKRMRQHKISVLEQDPYILEGSPSDNIYLTKNHCEKKYFSRIIKREIGPIRNNGEGISGGEKQKIGILRALAKQSDVLVFDEPTSALDQECRKEFFGLLQEIKEDKIILIISHDKEADLVADNIIKMSDL